MSEDPHKVVEIFDHARGVDRYRCCTKEARRFFQEKGQTVSFLPLSKGIQAFHAFNAGIVHQNSRLDPFSHFASEGVNLGPYMILKSAQQAAIFEIIFWGEIFGRDKKAIHSDSFEKREPRIANLQQALDAAKVMKELVNDQRVASLSGSEPSHAYARSVKQLQLFLTCTGGRLPSQFSRESFEQLPCVFLGISGFQQAESTAPTPTHMSDKLIDEAIAHMTAFQKSLNMVASPAVPVQSAHPAAQPPAGPWTPAFG